MPRGKKKQKNYEPAEPVQVNQQEDNEAESAGVIDEENLNNPNIEEYLPNRQTQWFHMVIQAQVKKVITQCLQEQQQSITQELTKVMEEKVASIVDSYEHKTKELEDTVSKLSKALVGVNKDLMKKK